MAFKGWFRGSGGAEAPQREEQGETIEDLIVLERYDEAETRLKAALRDDPDDLKRSVKIVSSPSTKSPTSLAA
jgi:hypothetical protein